MSRKAVLRARELGAVWACSRYVELSEEKERPSHTEGDDQKYEKWLELNEQHGFYLDRLVPRHDPILLQVFDELGGTEMTIDQEEILEVQVPDDVTYFIGSYIGEWVSEQHRVWSAEQDGDLAGVESFTKDSIFFDYRT